MPGTRDRPPSTTMFNVVLGSRIEGGISEAPNAVADIQRFLYSADPQQAVPATDPRWDQSALCGQTDPDAFFPENGGSTRAAKKICDSCEVRARCLAYALENDERFGIWGGLDPRERRRVKA